MIELLYGMLHKDTKYLGLVGVLDHMSYNLDCFNAFAVTACLN